MNDFDKELFADLAIRVNGPDYQFGQLIEELAELIQATRHIQRQRMGEPGKEKALEKFVKELADAELMIGIIKKILKLRPNEEHGALFEKALASKMRRAQKKLAEKQKWLKKKEVA